MSFFDKWNDRYKNNNCTKENLKKLVELKKLSFDQYFDITGEALELPIDELKANKIKFLDSYKHEKRMYFEYGNCGGIQRFDESTDLPFIQITLDGINRGLVTEINWKYSNGKYDNIKAPEAKLYLENMLLIGGMLLSVAFTVEQEIVNQINNIQTLEELKLFDEKVAFDNAFDIEKEKIIKAITNPLN